MTEKHGTDDWEDDEDFMLSGVVEMSETDNPKYLRYTCPFCDSDARYKRETNWGRCLDYDHSLYLVCDIDAPDPGYLGWQQFQMDIPTGGCLHTWLFVEAVQKELNAKRKRLIRLVK